MAQAQASLADTNRAIKEFREYLSSSDRVLALVGAGLSAPSGIPTFRGAGGMWRNHNPKSLATPEAFQRDPVVVWQFYNDRRHKALQAQPNPGHYALADLARRKPNFITLSQNVDGLSQRANHPISQLHLLHGSLFDVKCSNPTCTYLDPNNHSDPLIPYLSPNTLPHCPICTTTSLLRPGIVWFGEALPTATISAIDAWIDAADSIDLMLVIGTSAAVYPAADYINRARNKGARVAVVNLEAGDLGEMEEGDWAFVGNAAVILPDILGVRRVWV